jgi:hypothetical protein
LIDTPPARRSRGQLRFLEAAFRDPARFAVDFLALVDVALRVPERFAVEPFVLDFLDVDVRDVGLLEPVFLVLVRFALVRFALDAFRLGAFRLGVFRLGVFRLGVLRLGVLRPPAFAAFVLTFSETTSACSTAIASILSATVRTRSCAASVESSFLPSFTAVSFTPSFAMGVRPLCRSGAL